jgi:hypothetical protein
VFPNLYSPINFTLDGLDDSAGVLHLLRLGESVRTWRRQLRLLALWLCFAHPELPLAV